MEAIEELKIILREKDLPFFDDEELQYYLDKNEQSVDLAAYRCLVIKSQNTSLSLSGLTTSDTSKYFMRLASQYRPNNTGIMR